MANELSVSNFDVDFVPAQISIKDLDGLKKKAQEIVKKYEGSIATEETLKGDKAVLADLRSLQKKLNSRRIEIHKTYDAPYEEFKSDVDELTSILDKSIDPIDSSIKQLEEKQRNERKEHVLDLISDFAEQNNIEPDELGFDDKWTNKSMTDKKLAGIFEDNLTSIEAKKSAYEMGSKLIIEHCKVLGIDPAGWVSQLTDDTNAKEVIEAIDAHMEEESQRKIAEQKKVEAEKAKREALQTKVGDTIINKETGEVVQPNNFEWSMRLTGSKAALIHAFSALNQIDGVTVETIKGLSEVEATHEG